jgi:hypothetical protein
MFMNTFKLIFIPRPVLFHNVSLSSGEEKLFPSLPENEILSKVKAFPGAPYGVVSE